MPTIPNLNPTQDILLSSFLTETTKNKLVRLRGLPYTVTKPDIIRFFQPNFKIEENDVVIEVIKGKHTGWALALLPSDFEANWAAWELNKKFIGQRYIEVDLCANI